MRSFHAEFAPIDHRWRAPIEPARAVMIATLLAFKDAEPRISWRRRRKRHGHPEAAEEELVRAELDHDGSGQQLGAVRRAVAGFVDHAVGETGRFQVLV